MAGSYGPPLLPEICREILARMPVKSILRCRSVCKSCYSIISSPDFISHHSITNNNGNRLLLYHEDSSFSSHDIDIEYRVQYSPDRFVGREFRIVGSCNGLICLFESDYDCCSDLTTVTFLIWNPAIRKIVELPSITSSFRYKKIDCFGFGFDSNTRDYKVMCNLSDLPTWNGNTLDFKENVCDIFDLSKGVWRSISPQMPSPRIIPSPESKCYVNGAVHWSVYRYNGGIGRSVLSFNMSDESYREIMMPDCAEFTQCDDAYRIKARCETFGGLVHVVVWKERDDHVVEELESCSVWTMQEYGVIESWIKVSNIDLPSAQVLLCTQLCPNDFILWAKHEVLTLNHPPLDDEEGFCDKQDLVLYNTGSRKFKRLFTVTKYNYYRPLLCLYKESLVLM